MKAEILTPKQAAIRDMRAAGLDTTVLELAGQSQQKKPRNLSFVQQTMDVITPRSAPRFLECIGKRVKRTIISETTRI